MSDTTFRHGDPLSIDYTPGAGALEEGAVVLLGNLTGITCGIVPASGLANNVKGSLQVGGATYNCINLNNAANYAKVYWDDSAKKVTTVSTNNATFGFIETGGGGGANTTCEVLHWPYV